MLEGVRASTEEDKQALPWIDYSGLTALNYCPRWGAIHSVHGKRFKTNDREMPLEAGAAMHDMFAAVRMFELMDALAKSHGSVPDIVDAYGRKLFQSAVYPDRWDEALQIFDQEDDYDTRLMRFGLNLLETSGFHDNPNDRRRTQTNLETATIGYIDRYPKSRYIPLFDEQTGFIGVEVGFDIVLPTTPAIRFVGKVDGIAQDLYVKDHEKLVIQENKTGARIDQVWADGFTVGHQVTGYCVSMSAILNRNIRDAIMWGTQIPTPKTSIYGDGYMRQPVDRNLRQMREWLEWVQYTIQSVGPWLPGGPLHPTTAPMYTHSCNRFFRTCSLLPLCAEEPEQRINIYENEMVSEKWRPLEDLS